MRMQRISALLIIVLVIVVGISSADDYPIAKITAQPRCLKSFSDVLYWQIALDTSMNWGWLLELSEDPNCKPCLTGDDVGQNDCMPCITAQNQTLGVKVGGCRHCAELGMGHDCFNCKLNMVTIYKRTICIIRARVNVQMSLLHNFIFANL